MPQTAIIRKPQVSVLSLTGCKEGNPSQPQKKNLVQCVRRKLQYTQLPIRCQRRLYQRPAKSPFKLPSATASLQVKKTTSCPDNSGCRLIQSVGTPRCKKSLSMTDLSPVPTDREIGDLRSDSSSTLARLEEADERTTEALGDGAMSGSLLGVGAWLDRLDGEKMGPYFQDIDKAAGRVCHVLVVNAWRRRREEITHLQDTILQLSQQVDHLHIQIVVLRRLLDAENNRVGRFMAEMHRVKMQLDDANREREAFKEGKEKAEEEVKQLKDESEEKTVATENLRNELINAKTQLQALDAQITKDREKLLKLREDKRVLSDKVATSESQAAKSEEKAGRAEAAADNLKVRLTSQISLVTAANEHQLQSAKELTAKDDERLKLEKRLLASEEAGRTLSLRAANLENQLSDREAALRRLESAYNSQLLELNQLRERLTRQSQEVGWSSRVLQIAGSVVRAPRAILRTLSFLSNSGVPVTP